MTVVALVGALAGSAPASATSATPPAPPLRPLPQLLPLRFAAATNTTVFAGYEVRKGSSSVATTYIVPKINCGSATTGIGPGAYMVAGPADEEFDGADVSMECFNGKLAVGEYLIVNNSQTLYLDPVSAGDTIEASVSVTSEATDVSIKDLTAGHEFTLESSGAGVSQEDAEFAGIDTLSPASGPPFPVPAIASMPFTATSVGGNRLASVNPTALALTSGCAVTLTPSAISGGTNFNVASPALSITHLSQAKAATGKSVTITGSGFNANSIVHFNGNPANSVIHTSANQLMVTVPSTATTGPVSVTNSSPPVGTATSACNFAVIPTVSAVTPASGITGSEVTIKGSGFSAVSNVAFGALAASFKVASVNQITATVPDGAIARKLTVTTDAGSATSATAFNPTLSITSFSPATGGEGTLVTIRGVGFNASSTAAFGGVAAKAVKLVSAGELQAAVPAAAKPGAISVTNATAPVGNVTSAGTYSP